MSKDLIIIGAGGTGRQVADAIGDMTEEWNLLGYLDDDPLKQGKIINGAPVLGKIEDVVKYPNCYFQIILGNPQDLFIKKRFVQHLKIEMHHYATLVHPSAWVSRYAVIGRDTFVMPNSTIMPNVKVGDHVDVSSNVFIAHDTQIGDYVGMANSASIAGRVRIEEGAFIGANSSIKEDITIGQWSLIGLGSVVYKDIPSYQVWAGNPAKFVRKRK